MDHKRGRHIPDRPSATSSTSPEAEGSDRLVHKLAASSSASGGPPSLPFSDPTTNSRAPKSAQDRTRLRTDRSCTPVALGNIPSQNKPRSGDRIVHRSQRSLLSDKKAKMDGPARVQDEDDNDCAVDENHKVTWASDSETSDDLNDLWNRLSGRSYPEEHSVDFASDSSSDSDGRLQQVLSGKRVWMTQEGAEPSAHGITDSESGDGTPQVSVLGSVPATDSLLSKDALGVLALGVRQPRHPRKSASQDRRRAPYRGGKRRRFDPKRPTKPSLQDQRQALHASSLDLNYGLLAYNISSQADEWIEASAGVVEAAVTSFRSEAALHPGFREMFSILAESCGLEDPPQDEVITRMIECNREILREQLDLPKGCNSARRSVSLDRIADQHTCTASYLLCRDSLGLDEQVQADITTLKGLCADWRKTNAKCRGRDKPLFDELSLGAGGRLRDRMWNHMGWRISCAYNSRIALNDEAVIAAIDAHDPVDMAFQTAMDQAVIILGSYIAENDKMAPQMNTDIPLSTCGSSRHLAESLCLLKRYWNTFDWHEEGQRIALTPLIDMYGRNIRGASNFTSISARQAANQTLGDERLKESMASQNLRIISSLARSNIPKGSDWKRIGIQLSLNAEYLFRRAIKQGELSEAFDSAEFRESIKRLCDLPTFKRSTAEAQRVVTQSEGAILLQGFVSRHLPKDWTLQLDTSELSRITPRGA